MGSSPGRRIARGLLLWLLAFAGGTAPPAHANRQIDEPSGTLEEVEEAAQRARSLEELVEVRLYGGSEFVIGSDFEEFDATSYEPGGRIKVTVPVAKNAALRMVARGSALLYGFSDVSTDLFGTPTTGDPFDDLYSTSLELQAGLRPGWSGLFSDEERWTLFAEGATRARWERGATFTSAITGGGALGVGYQIGDWLEVLVGGGVATRLLRGGVSFFPVFELEWRFAERWRLRTRGQGGQLEYDIRDGLTAFVGGRYESRSYLTEDREPGIGEGRLRDRSVPLSLGLRWDASEFLEITFTGGAVLGHELKAQDDDREDLGRVRAGPAPFVGITLQLSPMRARRAAAAAQRDGGAASSSTSISTSR